MMYIISAYIFFVNGNEFDRCAYATIKPFSSIKQRKMNMADVITETTHKSYLNRVGGSFGGVIVGLILFFGSFVALWWNEGNFVRTARGLDEGKGAVVQLDAPKVKAENDGKLIYLTGRSETSETLRDPVFGIGSQALLLSRNVEMFQWKETKETKSRENLGGSEDTVTTYTYSKEWSDEAVASSDFKEPTGHTNPGSFPYPQNQQVAQNATVGEFTLNESVIKKIGGEKAVSVSGFDVATIPGSQLYGSYIYLGKVPATPEVGDVRVSFAAINPGDVSIVAQQNGSTFGPYRTKTSSTIELVSNSKRTSDELFTAAEQANDIMTWIIRGLGFGAMWLGLMLILGPLSMFFAFIPFLRSVTGFLVGIATFVVALVLGALTVALAWLFYRPLVSFVLIVGAVAIAWGIKVAILDKRKPQTEAQPMPYPAAPEPASPPVVQQAPIVQPPAPMQPPAPQPVAAPPIQQTPPQVVPPTQDQQPPQVPPTPPTV